MRTIADLIKIIFDILDQAVTLLALLAIALFFWGLARFLFSGGDEASLKNGKMLMTWGFVGVFVIFSVWGLVALISATFFDTSVTVLPQLPTR